MKVLLADDHRIVREGLRWMLDGESDIEVVAEASDGADMLRQLDEIEVDIVLLDVRMPDVGGLDALERLTRATPARGAPKFIVLSMHGEPAYVRRAIELGACGYLLKKATRDELLAALRRVAAGGGYVQEELTAGLLDWIANPEPAAAVGQLTDREREVLAFVAQGLSNRQIAAQLEIGEATVKTHLEAVFERLGVPNRAAAVAEALHRGLID